MTCFELEFIEQRLDQHRPELIDDRQAPRRAAVSIILRHDPAAEWSLLFIHRSTHSEDPWSGHMAFPGGRQSEEDLSLLHAARRETLEEVSIDLEQQARLLGRLDDLRASARGHVLPLAISPFVFLLTQPTHIACNEEVEEALWVPVRQLLEPSSASTVPYDLAGQRYHLPCYRVSGRVIWGLTFQMVTRLFSLLGWSAG